MKDLQKFYTKTVNARKQLPCASWTALKRDRQNNNNNNNNDDETVNYGSTTLVIYPISELIKIC